MPRKRVEVVCPGCGARRTIIPKTVETQCRRCASVGRNRKHGLSDHPLYQVHAGMLIRCGYTDGNGARDDWAGRGITVCEEWRSDKLAFIAWGLANGYRPGLVLDRRDNDGHYEPGNCHFVTWVESARNRRSVRITYETAGEIRRRLSAGESAVSIARQFQINKGIVFSIKYGRAWKEA